MTNLMWLPKVDGWRDTLKAFAKSPDPTWAQAVSLANACLDFSQTNALDEIARRRWGETVPDGITGKPVRIAVLGSSTLAHLQPSIRVGGLRRGLHVAVYENDYGQYRQELEDEGSALYAFRPTVVLFALDAVTLTSGLRIGQSQADARGPLDATLEEVRHCWRLARRAFGGMVIQQACLPVFPSLLGNNEHRLTGSRAWAVTYLNDRLRAIADEEGVEILAVDAHVAEHGLGAWHSEALWHRSKQEVALTAAPLYGDLVARLVAAKQGRSFKCLALDLDNTLWGGVIGDDGLEGITLGQGSALGEAYVAFQAYARDLSRRGVILAVCSKNDEKNAREPFERHPDMILRSQDISCFVANWTDKATNLRHIAKELNIGIDSIVFVDDNPFERNLVRQELPMVAVPEVSDDPTFFPRILAAAGYFEGLAVTEDDLARTTQYAGNQQRESFRSQATDMASYLAGLEMRLISRDFDRIGLQRIVQLINKTNQFNLTTRRYTDAQVQGVMEDGNAVGLQLRLTDRFGDNGIIGIVIGRLEETDFIIDTWLMSCRVLGRQVEVTTLNVIAERARALGARRLVGEYIATAKNGMVREHYQNLGFTVVHSDELGSRSELDIEGFSLRPTAITMVSE
ncbi:HAD superfamily phosphatase (TIGR01681 family)/FkbH-like protein [Nitrospirillum viridazoti]|nr:HAD superfamily phosphatase (TIGR01681 family)/FkbH-like protein [Nitrospirillum amazonense]